MSFISAHVLECPTANCTHYIILLLNIGRTIYPNFHCMADLMTEQAAEQSSEGSPAIVSSEKALLAQYHEIITRLFRPKRRTRAPSRLRTLA